jgi:hypothetical protein
VAECILRAEVGDPQRGLHGAAATDELTEDRTHGVIAKWTGIGLNCMVDDFRLADRIKQGLVGVTLQLADLLGDFGAAIDGRQNLGVDAIQLAA